MLSETGGWSMRALKLDLARFVKTEPGISLVINLRGLYLSPSTHIRTAQDDQHVTNCSSRTSSLPSQRHQELLTARSPG